MAHLVPAHPAPEGGVLGFDGDSRQPGNHVSEPSCCTLASLRLFLENTTYQKQPSGSARITTALGKAEESIRQKQGSKLSATKQRKQLEVK